MWSSTLAEEIAAELSPDAPSLWERSVEALVEKRRWFGAKPGPNLNPVPLEVVNAKRAATRAANRERRRLLSGRKKRTS